MSISRDTRYQDLREKYRPRRFEQLAQGIDDPAIKVITRAISHGPMPAAFLLRAGFGCAKTTIARIIGERACCTNQHFHPFEPCGECDGCRIVMKDPHCASFEGYDEYDVQWASPRDTIESIFKTVPYSKSGGSLMPQRVVVLDEFHRLPLRDQEKFVKVIEDCAAQWWVVFVLCSAPRAVIHEPIVQRCMLVPLSTPTRDQAIRHARLIAKAEHRDLNDADAELLVAAASYIPRQYLGLLQQAILLSEKAESVTREAVLLACSMADAFQITDGKN